jgi:hypothetical protein
MPYAVFATSSLIQTLEPGRVIASETGRICHVEVSLNERFSKMCECADIFNAVSSVKEC